MKTNVVLNESDMYWNMLKNLSADVKLKLISKLSKSLVSKKEDSKSSTWADSFYGEWKEDESAEETIAKLRNSRMLGTRELESF